MTPQPCVSCWSAIVEYLLTSPWAFWMSTSKPASSRPSCRYLRSKFSQRGDDAASGRITHARPASVSPPPPPSPPVSPPPDPPVLQPARRNAAADESATTESNEDFCIFHPLLMSEYSGCHERGCYESSTRRHGSPGPRHNDPVTTYRAVSIS